jgi:hypothetical protein
MNEVIPEPEETAVVPGLASAPAGEVDATAVVAARPLDDATAVVPALVEQKADQSEALPGPLDDATRVTPQPGAAGQPVEEPEVARGLAGVMFKPPLDPYRAVRESPFPQTEQTLPKTGVRQGIPVVYGARSESAEDFSADAAALDARIGPPPADGSVVPAQRAGLPSVAKQNRKYRAIALFGGAGVVLVVGVGLWSVAQLAFGL